MEILNVISIYIVPFMIFIIIAHGIIRRVDVFSSFQKGAKNGLETVVQILPALLAIFVGISMFRASGTLDIIANFMSPILNFLHLPAEVLPLALMRPISGSASVAIVSDLINTHGADSIIGRISSVMMGSTETTFYTLAVYFSSIGVHDSRWTVKAALLADLTGILASTWIVNFFSA
ncbi:MAG: spore maturation protein [Clostridiales bacterium]|jgi:spore maturation protein B|nr:spore maturation protein [Clostridiales bacterium]